MSKLKRRAQGNNRGAFALDLTAEQFVQWVVERWKPHHILRFQRRRERLMAA